jgi:hypothetical protein
VHAPAFSDLHPSRKEAKDFYGLTRLKPMPAVTGTKVFWFFFSKKNGLLS